MADKVTTPMPAPAEGPKTLTLGMDELDAIVRARVAAAFAALTPAPAPLAPVVLTTDQVAFTEHQRSMAWRFVPGVGYTNVPEGHDPVTGRKG